MFHCLYIRKNKCSGKRRVYHENIGKSKRLCGQVHGRHRHCGGGTVSAVPRHLQRGKDRMGQHPAGHRHVRHGSYPEAGGLQGGVQPPEGCDHRLHCAVHPDALPCMGAAAAVPPAHRAGYRRHPCGYLPRRHLL